MFIGLREIKREREMWERNMAQLPSECTPNWGSNLRPSDVSWLGIKPTNIWCMVESSNQLSHPVRTTVLPYTTMELIFVIFFKKLSSTYPWGTLCFIVISSTVQIRIFYFINLSVLFHIFLLSRKISPRKKFSKI